MDDETTPALGPPTSVRLRSDHAEAVRLIAEDEHRSIGNVINRLLGEALAARSVVVPRPRAGSCT